MINVRRCRNRLNGIIQILDLRFTGEESQLCLLCAGESFGILGVREIGTPFDPRAERIEPRSVVVEHVLK